MCIFLQCNINVDSLQESQTQACFTSNPITILEDEKVILLDAPIDSLSKKSRWKPSVELAGTLLSSHPAEAGHKSRVTDQEERCYKGKRKNTHFVLVKRLSPLLPCSCNLVFAVSTRRKE